jgi:hypothetical protein
MNSDLAPSLRLLSVSLPTYLLELFGSHMPPPPPGTHRNAAVRAVALTALVIGIIIAIIFVLSLGR